MPFFPQAPHCLKVLDQHWESQFWSEIAQFCPTEPVFTAPKSMISGPTCPTLPRPCHKFHWTHVRAVQHDHSGSPANATPNTNEEDEECSSPLEDPNEVSQHALLRSAGVEHNQGETRGGRGGRLSLPICISITTVLRWVYAL